MPKLSIITINYNNAVGLAETIESVLTQTGNDFEYIVIDGGSTDDSIDVIKKFEHKITYWVSERDRGIYHAMNKGIRQAKGDYCQFLNSGDYLVSSDVIEQMFRKEPTASILLGAMMTNGSGEQKIRDVGSQPSLSFLTFYRGTLNHSSAYIKRSLFDAYGLYDESLSIVSDWKFYLIAVGLHNESVDYLNVDVSYFDTAGISNKETELLKAERRAVLEELVSPAILADYDRYWFDIEQMTRLKRFTLIKYGIWFAERILFKLEKWRVLTKKEFNY